VKRHAEQPYVGKMLSAALAGGLCRCDPEIEWGREP
jgi:hypothetical protein